MSVNRNIKNRVTKWNLTMNQQQVKLRTKFVLIRALSIGIISIIWGLCTVSNVAATTIYIFDQTDHFGTIKGTITIENGVFFNQAAADALNTSEYSITLSSLIAPTTSFTLTQDNSTWSFSNYDPNNNFTLSIVANGNTLEFREMVSVENYSYFHGELIVQSDDLGLFRFIVRYDSHWMGELEFMRQGNNWFRDIFLSTDLRKDFIEAPFTQQFVYSFPAIDPVNQINDIINKVQEIQETTNVSGLGQSLNEAENVLTDDNPANDRAVCGMLNAFINQVDAKQDSGILTEEQAKDLRLSVESIKANLPC